MKRLLILIITITYLSLGVVAQTISTQQNLPECGTLCYRQSVLGTNGNIFIYEVVYEQEISVHIYEIDLIATNIIEYNIGSYFTPTGESLNLAVLANHKIIIGESLVTGFRFTLLDLQTNEAINLSHNLQRVIRPCGQITGSRHVSSPNLLGYDDNHILICSAENNGRAYMNLVRLENNTLVFEQDVVFGFYGEVASYPTDWSSIISGLDKKVYTAPRENNLILSSILPNSINSIDFDTLVILAYNSINQTWSGQTVDIPISRPELITNDLVREVKLIGVDEVGNMYFLEEIRDISFTNLASSIIKFSPNSQKIWELTEVDLGAVFDNVVIRGDDELTAFFIDNSFLSINVPSLPSLTLLDSASLPIAGHEPLLEGASIDLANITALPLNLRANTNPATVGSVVFDLNGTVQTDDSAPYEFTNWMPSVGTYTLTATPYSSAGGTGTAGTPLTINFTVTNSLEVSSISLIESISDTPVSGFDPIFEGASIDLASLSTSQFALRANMAADENISPMTIIEEDSVVFDLNGTVQIDDSAPYEFTNWTPTVGSYTLTATPYSGAGGTGTPLTINFTVTNSLGVSSISLIEPVSDTPVSGFDPIFEGASIDLASLSTSQFALRANMAADENISLMTIIEEDSVVFDLNGTVQIDDSVPYEFTNWTPTVGSYTLTATPYSGAGGTGTPLTINFTVTNSLGVSSISLIEPISDTEVSGFDPMLEGTSIDLASLPTLQFSLRANMAADENISLMTIIEEGSVIFELNGVIQVDNESPYEFSNWAASVGTYTLTASPYTGVDGTGIAGIPLTLHFTVNSNSGILDAPSISAPTSPTADTTPDLVWTSIPNAITYRVYLAGSAGRVLEDNYAASPYCTGSTCTLTLPTLAEDNYRAYVRAGNGSAWGDWSTNYPFALTSQTSVPAAPIANAPTGYSNNLSPTVAWTAVSGASLYTVYVRDLANVNYIHQNFAASEVCNGTACSLTLPISLPMEKSYLAYVRGYNPLGYGAWSIGQSFIVTQQSAISTSPSISSPTGTISNNLPTVTWAAIPNASSYILYIRDGANVSYFNQSLAAENVCIETTCSYTLTNPLANNTYFAFVRGVNIIGQGAWSSAAQFTVSSN